ncbi:MAG: hypothetical protein ACN6O3_18205 [Comamonas sp.]
MHRTIYSYAFLGTLALSAAMLFAGRGHAATAASPAAQPAPEAVAACAKLKEGAKVKLAAKDGKPADAVCRKQNGTLVAIPLPRASIGPR